MILSDYPDKIGSLQGTHSPTLPAGCPIVEELIQLNRNRAYYRKQRKRVIHNKSRLLKRLGGGDFYEGWTRGYPGRLAKGKIHCSCWMCRTKSYDYPSHRDVRRKLDAKQQAEEYWNLGLGMGVLT